MSTTMDTHENTGANPIDVSIIVVNWKVRDLLRACLESVRDAAGLQRDRYEVVVVDNDSGDGSPQMLQTEFPWVRTIANTDNVGFGRANNQALPFCRGRYVLLLNPDTLVLDGGIGQLVRHMDERPDVAVMGCRLLNADHSLQRWTGGAFPRLLNLANHYFFLDRILPSAMRPPPLYLDHDASVDIAVDWVSGACMILRSDRLMGRLFNPDFFMYGEDMELCHRLKLAGGGIVYTPVASIVHYQGESMKQQQGDVLLSSLKGPRQFYLQMRGERAVWVFDAITMAGFGLRWLLYSAAAAVKPAGSFRRKARSSRDLMQRAGRIMKAAR